jgi:hypothetical protein
MCQNLIWNWLRFKTFYFAGRGIRWKTSYTAPFQFNEKSFSDLYSVLRLLIGLRNAALMVCMAINEAVTNVNAAIDNIKG